jgi:hypothetical protein
VEEQIKADRLFFKFNVESNVYLEAVKRHKLGKDEIAKSVAQSMDAQIPQDIKERIIQAIQGQDESCDDLYIGELK